MNKYYKCCSYNTESLSKVCQEQISSKNEIISDKDIRIEKYKEKLKSDNSLQRLMVHFSYEKNGKVVFKYLKPIVPDYYKQLDINFIMKDFKKQILKIKINLVIHRWLHHVAKNKYLQIFLNMIQMECQYIKAYQGTTPSHLAHLRQIVINHFNYLSIMEQIIRVKVVLIPNFPNAKGVIPLLPIEQYHYNINIQIIQLQTRTDHFKIFRISRNSQLIYIIFQYHQFYQQSNNHAIRNRFMCIKV